MNGKKKYSELQAWSIFIGGLIIGIVVTSIFWAYTTIPKHSKKAENSSENSLIFEKINESFYLEKPIDFISFCRTMKGTPKWDSSGFKQCIVRENTEKNLVSMSFLCKKFNLNLSYGSDGIKCEGINKESTR